MTTELQITLSIIKLEADMIASLFKASTLDRVGRWEDAESQLSCALALLRKIGVLESTCEGVDKEVERGLDDLFEGEFLTDEFIIEEFTKQTFKVIWL